MFRNWSLFRDAPLMNRTATPAVAVLAIISWLGPTPPARPSMIQLVPVLMSTVAVVLALVMLGPTAGRGAGRDVFDGEPES
jgi:hypothetical protein